MEQLTKNQAVATSQEAVQNQNEPQLRDENAHNDKSVHEHCANSSINFSVTDTNSSRTSEAALWPSTYISPLSNSTPCIRKDRISSKSLMRLSICLWKPSIGD